MAGETIPLAKGFEPKKLMFPVFASIKIDGVPIRVTVTEVFDKRLVHSSGPMRWFDVQTVSRQGETVVSCHKLVDDFVTDYIRRGLPLPVSFVFEVAQRGNPYAPFKDTSGIVRSQYDRSDELALWMFECDQGATFAERVEFMRSLNHITENIHVLHQTPSNNPTVLSLTIDALINAHPKQEGLVLRSHDAPFEPGCRHWHYQKIVKEPMIDLKVVSFEEAMSKDGEPLGMVGRINVLYKGEETGVGPGKMTHEERKNLWEIFGTGPVYDEINGPDHPMAQIKYKPDDSYDGLRQGTFQCWRPDKKEPDA